MDKKKEINLEKRKKLYGKAEQLDESLRYSQINKYHISNNSYYWENIKTNIKKLSELAY